jgi:hypothetical protein
MPRRRKPLPDATPDYEPDRQDESRSDPLSYYLDRGLAAAAAWYIVDLLKLCEVPSELDEVGRDLARRLASVGGIRQQMEDRLTLMGKG